MMSPASRNLARALAAAALVLGVQLAATPSARAAPTLLQSSTSPDGLLTLTLSSTNPSDSVGVDNTYIWTATNNSTTVALTGVILGSHFGDWCGGGQCYPQSPTLVSVGAGCGGQSASEFPEPIAHFGVWCSPATGTTLAPGASITGSVTLRPGSGGPPDYTVYTGYNDPVTGAFQFAIPRLKQSSTVAPGPTDIQVKGAASNGSPPVGSTFSYVYQVKNAGPWGTYGGVIFADTLPASLAYADASVQVTLISPITGQPATAIEHPCSAVAQTVVCPLFDMQASGISNQVTITLDVVASTAPQQIVNTASIHTVTPQADSNAANNGVTVTVTTK